MRNLKEILIMFLIVILIIVPSYFLVNYYKESFNNETNIGKSYKGLVLFDIDGTLTVNSKEKNYEIVDYCLRKNFAVGVSTAGSIYSMQNLLSFEWMPENLHEFMQKHNDLTFNNVGSMIVNGTRDFNSFKNIYETVNLDIMEKLGYAKGFTIHKTANILGIKDNDKVILCDDLQEFINGYKLFSKEHNKNYKYIYCENGINMSEIKNLIK
tara:strand:+ start:1669 stop:2301 length:633 start_codon:yes stop_codon:yes gene_type:complete